MSAEQAREETGICTASPSVHGAAPIIREKTAGGMGVGPRTTQPKGSSGSELADVRAE